jgi:predicted Zn-dependent protease
MRTFPPLNFCSIRTTLVQSILAGMVLLSTSARADVYEDVERLIRNGQLERAGQISSAHLHTSPQDPQMRLLGSRILLAQNKTDEALAQLESLTREFPELPEPHNNLAVLYARLGRTQDALDSLNKALLARPDYTVALENLGDLHLSLALQAYERANRAPTPPASVTRKADAIAPLLKH